MAQLQHEVSLRKITKTHSTSVNQRIFLELLQIRLGRPVPESKLLGTVVAVLTGCPSCHSSNSTAVNDEITPKCAVDYDTTALSAI